MKQKGFTLLQAVLGLSLLAMLSQFIYQGLIAYTKPLEQQTLWLQRQAKAMYLLNRVERSLQASGFFLDATRGSQSFSEVIQNKPHLAPWQCAFSDQSDAIFGMQPIVFNRCSAFERRSNGQGILLSYLQHQAQSRHQTVWCEQAVQVNRETCSPSKRWYLVHEGYQLGEAKNKGQLLYVWANLEGRQLKFYREVLDSGISDLDFKYLLKSRSLIDSQVYYRYIDANAWDDIDFEAYVVVAVQVTLTFELKQVASQQQSQWQQRMSRWVLL